MEKFGQYLLRNAIISQEQLNEALQCQVIFGGRLGTNLVELGYLTLDDLARLLSRRSGFPAASVEEVEDLPKETLNALPRALIDKFKLIPIRIEAKTLHCAICDPTDLRAVDEIAFSTGMRVKPYLLPELRMFYLLEKHYGIKREIRYIRLGRTLSRGKYAGALSGSPTDQPTNGASAEDAPAFRIGDPPSPAANIGELEAKGFRPLRAGEELSETGDVYTGDSTPPGAMTAFRPQSNIGPHAPGGLGPPLDAPVLGTMADPIMLLDDTNLEPLEEATPAPLPESAPAGLQPPSTPDEASEIRHVLMTAPDREDVAGAALRLARSHFKTSAMFIVNKGLVLGWRAAGGLLDKQSIESLMLPSSAESIFRGPASNGTSFQGAIPKGGLNERLMSGLGRSLPITALVVPVLVKGRVVNLFYADNGAEPVNAAAAGYIQLLARDIGGAYERIILAKKKSTAESASRG